MLAGQQRCRPTATAARSWAPASCGCRTGSCRCCTRSNTTRSWSPRSRRGKCGNWKPANASSAWAPCPTRRPTISKAAAANCWRWNASSPLAPVLREQEPPHSRLCPVLRGEGPGVRAPRRVLRRRPRHRRRGQDHVGGGTGPLADAHRAVRACGVRQSRAPSRRPRRAGHAGPPVAARRRQVLGGPVPRPGRGPAAGRTSPGRPRDDHRDRQLRKRAGVRRGSTCAGLDPADAAVGSRPRRKQRPTGLPPRRIRGDLRSSLVRGRETRTGGTPGRPAHNGNGAIRNPKSEIRNLKSNPLPLPAPAGRRSADAAGVHHARAAAGAVRPSRAAAGVGGVGPGGRGRAGGRSHEAARLDAAARRRGPHAAGDRGPGRGREPARPGPGAVGPRGGSPRGAGHDREPPRIDGRPGTQTSRRPRELAVRQRRTVAPPPEAGIAKPDSRPGRLPGRGASRDPGNADGPGAGRRARSWRSN